jgi:hypothetical protein
VTTHPKNTLMSMGQELPTVTQNLRGAVDNIDATKAAVQEQIDALEDQVMSAMASASIVWIANKRTSLNPTWSYITSGAFGTLNVTQWGIYDPSQRKSSPLYNRYLDTDVTSAGYGSTPASEETKQYNRQIEFPIVYDHIHHVTGLNGSYGLQAKLDSLDDGRALTLANEEQYTAILKISDKYSGEKKW